jgi:hypothetical protein
MNRPGEDLINEGLADLKSGRETIASLLVSIGSPRLKRAGLVLPELIFDDPEHRLYLLLQSTNPDGAHSQYNAFIRRLVSFERALECGI